MLSLEPYTYNTSETDTSTTLIHFKVLLEDIISLLHKYNKNIEIKHKLWINKHLTYQYQLGAETDQCAPVADEYVAADAVNCQRWQPSCPVLAYCIFPYEPDQVVLIVCHQDHHNLSHFVAKCPLPVSMHPKEHQLCESNTSHQSHQTGKFGSTILLSLQTRTTATT